MTRLQEVEKLLDNNLQLITDYTKRAAELESKHWNECRQIARYDDELRKAKELLKAAVEDMNKEADCGICLHDNDGECPIEVASCKFKWRYADEALALIGEDTNVPATATDINVGGKGGNDNA